MLFDSGVSRFVHRGGRHFFVAERHAEDLRVVRKFNQPFGAEGCADDRRLCLVDRYEGQTDIIAGLAIYI